MTERIVTRAIIVDDEGKVLLGKRARGHGANQYALVGGKPDPDEALEVTAKREVFEELGVSFEPVFYREKVDDVTDPVEPWRVIYYTGDIEGEIRPNPDEISEVVFVNQDELGSLDIAFDHRERLQEFFEDRNKNE